MAKDVHTMSSPPSLNRNGNNRPRVAFTAIDVLTMGAAVWPRSIYSDIVYTAHLADPFTRILDYAVLLTTGLVVGVALAWSWRTTLRIFF